MMRHNHMKCDACRAREERLVMLLAEVKYYRRQFGQLEQRIGRILDVENHNGGKKSF